MDQNIHALLQAILKKLNDMDYIRLPDIPDIDLYMDQVTTFMDTHLSTTKRHTDDKVLTKTMINNYAKNNLLPPPTKKKYNKNHILILSFIYYFKSILSIKDIETILKPLTVHHFHEDSEVDLSSIYEKIRVNAKKHMEILPKELEELFTQTGEEEQDATLDLFYIISQLSIEVYVKKFIIEQLIDYAEMNTSEKK